MSVTKYFSSVGSGVFDNVFEGRRFVDMRCRLFLGSGEQEQ